jgi:ribosome maturation factor RimP
LRWARRPTFLFGARETEALPIDIDEIARIVAPSLEAMGYQLVRVMQTGGQHRPTLQVMAERRDDTPMSVEDCAEISRSLSAVLDVADPIVGAYTLEISSPGLDRPLVRPEDYDRFAGFEARVELKEPVDGRRRYKGRLLGRAGADVRLLADPGEVKLPLDLIARAKLVLTDDLLMSAQKPASPQ